MLTPGLLLQNRYQIIKLLGQGGMGAVYQASALALGGKFVAIKENIGGDPVQFKQEVVILANLSHSNLPRVLDHFVEPAGAQYLVMDFVEGEDLDTLIQQQGSFPEAQVLAWMNQILNAVTYLHSHGIIHRDIKPANIKITPTGQAVLVDFGIAKVFQAGWSTLTGAKAGTPGFAAPEQYRGGTDQHSDIYSLGATLYALLTGSAQPDAKALETRSASLTPPRGLNPNISIPMEQAILRAMAVSPNARFQTTGEMCQALQNQFISRTVPAQRSDAVVAAPTVRTSRNNFVLLGFLGVILLVGLGGAGLGGWWLAHNFSITPTRQIVATVGTVTPTVRMILPSPTGSIIFPTTTSTGLASALPTNTAAATWTRTATLSVTRTPSPVRSATAVPPSSPQKKFDSTKDGIFIIDLASGAQTKVASIDGIASSAAWAPGGDRAVISWLKAATVKQGNGQFICGYSWKYNSWRGSYYGPDYCNNAPSYFPGTYGGGLKLVSRNGETIADLVSGSPEPHFVGDPQVSYTDAIWSPDGSRIAVSYKQADGNRCPFIGNSSAAGLRKLDNCEADDHPRFWSIDGKWLITWSEREPKLYAYEVNGSRRVAFEQLGKLQIYDQRYFPWKVIDQPVCKGDTGFWSCQ